LDALFYEDDFKGELKNKLQLTDQQITRLKTVSHESVEQLAEDGTGDYQGSTREAARRSEEQIRSIIGEDKATQLFQLVNQRYSSGDVEGMMSTEPNAVPKDTRLVVNAPAYRMDLFQDGRLLKTYKIGIGYPEFPLPTGMRRAETIIFNPIWTPPDEPWVKGKFKPGQAVEAGSKDNPLGPIKIPIGLPNLIHGGKAPAKLGGFASHGCVGLTNDGVREFALMLAQLSGSSLTQEEASGYGQNRSQTKNYKLAKAIPVELRYETIVAEDGALHIFRDVYERGTNTMANLRGVLQAHGVTYDQLAPAEKQAIVQALNEMNRDPRGNAIVEDIEVGAGTDSVAGGGNDPTKSDKAKQGKETKTIVGRREIAIPLAQLRGKGYPEPANPNNGMVAKTAATPTR
jgi:lipoprotein-anchoring transpeptidase ErfK/SrfK